MAYENRPVQATTANALPTGTDPMVDNTAAGDVQAIKLINPTAGSVAPWLDQAARAQSLPVALSTEDAALLGTLLTASAYTSGIGVPETGQALGAGGSGNLGWLSSIRKAITDRLPAALVGGRLDVNIGASATVPVSGTFFQATQPVSVAIAPALVASAAIIGKVGIDQTTPGTTNAVSVANFPSTQPVSGAFFQATQPVSAASLPLPALASTSTLQTAGNASLSSIDTKTPALGITAAALATPVWTAGNVTAATTLQSAATANGNGSALDVTGYPTAVFRIAGMGSATVTFEIDDGSATWTPLLTTQLGANAIANTTTANGFFRGSVAGMTQVRARISGYASGTITIVASASSAIAANKSIVSPQLPAALAANGGMKIEGVVGGVALPVSGTVTADTELPAAAALSDTTANPTTPVIGALLQLWDGSANWVRAMFDHATNKALRVSLYGKATAAGDTAILLDANGRQFIVGSSLALTGSAGALNGDVIASTDVSAYAHISVQITGTWVGTITFQMSDDNSTWLTCPLSSQTLAANGIVFGAIHTQFFRARLTAYTSGTAACTGLARSLAAPPNTMTLVRPTDNTQIITSAPNDAASNSQVLIGAQSFSQLYNSTTWDRQRANNAVVALASAARTATANADVVTYNAKTFKVILNITSAPNTASTLTVAIRVKDSISGNYITKLPATAITGSAVFAGVPNTTDLQVGAGLVATANVSASEALARTMNVIVTHSTADSWTYSVSVELGV